MAQCAIVALARFTKLNGVKRTARTLLLLQLKQEVGLDKFAQAVQVLSESDVNEIFKELSALASVWLPPSLTDFVCPMQRH